MNIAPDDRVNMSLDAIIKSSRQAKKAEKKEKTKQNPKDAAAKGPKAKGDQKIAKTVAQGKAKRAAAVNQKRGLNESGKATTKDIKNAEKKQPTKPVAKKNQPQAGGLRISFKPGDLGRTTDKTMAAQIRGVLSKDPSSKKSAVAKNSADQGGRKVIQPKAPPKKKLIVRR